MATDWVIAGERHENVTPIVGKTYTILDSRKGKFVGKIVSVNGEWAEVEVMEGKIRWASNENRLFNPDPIKVNIRASLVYLVERTVE